MLAGVVGVSIGPSPYCWTCAPESIAMRLVACCSHHVVIRQAVPAFCVCSGRLDTRRGALISCDTGLIWTAQLYNRLAAYSSAGLGKGSFTPDEVRCVALRSCAARSRFHRNMPQYAAIYRNIPQRQRAAGTTSQWDIAHIVHVVKFAYDVINN